MNKVLAVRLLRIQDSLSSEKLRYCNVPESVSTTASFYITNACICTEMSGCSVLARVYRHEVSLFNK